MMNPAIVTPFLCGLTALSGLILWCVVRAVILWAASRIFHSDEDKQP